MNYENDGYFLAPKEDRIIWEIDQIRIDGPDVRYFLHGREVLLPVYFSELEHYVQIEMFSEDGNTKLTDKVDQFVSFPTWIANNVLGFVLTDCAQKCGYDQGEVPVNVKIREKNG